MTAPIPDDLIVLEHVKLTLGGHQVLRDISLVARRGETTAILGASGSGKTTILRVILGLARPESGTVLVGGRDITQLTERELPSVRRNIAMVFQSAALFDSLTVRENVGYRLWEHRLLPEAEIDARVHDSLQFVGLEDTAGKLPAELSGGMRKRVGIARALASGAPIILYDEPTGGLDPINTSLVSRLITSLKGKGMTQVVVTHDLETAQAVADHIIMMQRGAVIFAGTPAALNASGLRAIREFLDPSTVKTPGRLSKLPDVVYEPSEAP